MSLPVNPRLFRSLPIAPATLHAFFDAYAWQPARQLTMPSKSRKPVRTGAWNENPLTNKPERYFEAGAGIEPANSGFADRDLTTWLPRRVARAHNIVVTALVSSAEHRYIGVRRGERLYIAASTL